MDNIVDPTHEFDFSQLSLGNPASVQGGAYFTKIFNSDKPLYIQTPKSLTKQGFVKNAKKYYVELMFDTNDEKFFHWLENLETRCQQLIFEKRETWFQNQLDLTDIETAFATTVRPYKSCKYYLLRVNVKMNYTTNLPVVKIYNENETPLTIDDVGDDTNVISILEIQGIKFTSRNFQIEMELKQVMTLNAEIFLDNCLIKTTSNKVKREPSAVQIKEKEKEEEKEAEKEVKLELEKDKEKVIESISIDFPSSSEDSLDESENIVENNLGIETDELKEFDITDISALESITLKKPNQVYYEMYKEARKKAKLAKKDAILAFLEAKNIKDTYMLENLDDSDGDSDLENMSETSEVDLEEELKEQV